MSGPIKGHVSTKFFFKKKFEQNELRSNKRHCLSGPEVYSGEIYFSKMKDHLLFRLRFCQCECVLCFSGNLVIRNVTRQDQGTYICRGENGEGRRAVAAVSFVEVLRKYTPYIVTATIGISLKLHSRNICFFVFFFDLYRPILENADVKCEQHHLLP